MKVKIKYLTIIGNLIFLIWIIYSIFEDFPEGMDLLFPSLFLILLALNIYFIIKKDNEIGWFALFLERKALEEKKKIDNLNTQ